jgi:phosphomannomutase
MPLIKSISGIRGTIGGIPGDGLTPSDIVKFTTAFALLIRERAGSEHLLVIVGRDARTSGAMVNSLVVGTLISMGIDVIDAGLSTTPTVEMAVLMEHADGGIIITASHNPEQWNALKLLNEKGEFLSARDGQWILELADNPGTVYVMANRIGHYKPDDSYIKRHIEKILALQLVDADVISKAGFTIAIDCVNSTGGIALPILFDALGVKKINRINCEPDGHFSHNPEPLPENLGEISEVVMKTKSHAGFVVDPDVDRLAIIMEDGGFFGEEYTLVSVADYVLKNAPGNTVSNLSSTKALRDITKAAGGNYFASAVGEVNVVEKMKQVGAVIGGEGNGGVIYPPLHYGRDALVGIALFLTYLGKSGKSCSALRRSYPDYFISKNKIDLKPGSDIEKILENLRMKYPARPVDTTDGLWIDFDREWVHLRRSNTEPILRIYAESSSLDAANALAAKFIDDISRISC